MRCSIPSRSPEQFVEISEGLAKSKGIANGD